MGTHQHETTWARWWRTAGDVITPERMRWVVIRAGVAAGLLMILAVVGIGVLYATVSLPEEPERAQTSVILDSQGEVIAQLHSEEHRFDVRLDEVSPIMRQAVVATEDRNFYRHSGLDPSGIARALWNDVRGRRLQGGSTITQQLVKNQHLHSGRSLTRKVREAVLAVKVERQLSKDAILERYLNTVYFGRGAYGVEAAAQVYFGVSAAELDLPQAALLAGLIRAPESADPETRPDDARTRRAIVLRALVETEVIDAHRADAADRAPIDALPRETDTPLEAAGSAAHFADQVRAWAVREFGERAAFGGGLRIHTTLDSRMQAVAEMAVRSVLDQPDDPEAALVAIDGRGAVLAMIGGRDFRESKVNLALGQRGGGSGRQAGSTFKPFVLAAAIEDGIPVLDRFPAPASIILDTPTGPWTVANFGNRAYDDLDLVEATTLSVNTVYAQLIERVGPEAVVRAAHGAGIESDLEPLASLALGAQDVSPLEMTRAFMTFANRGQRPTPYYVTKVTEANGAVLHTASPEREDVMPTQHADLLNWVLRHTIDRGTGRAAAIGRPAAGKTGTTQDFGDAWFAGYTPTLAATVWMGYPEGQSRPMDSVRGRPVTGGSLPAQIWQRFMVEALAGIDTGDFAPPPDDLLQAPTTTIDPDDTTTTTEEPEETTTTEEADDTTTTTEAPEETTTTTTTAPEETTTTTTTASGDG